MAKDYFINNKVYEIIVDSSLFAIQFYEKLGFKKLGKIQKTKFEMKYQPMAYKI